MRAAAAQVNASCGAPLAARSTPPTRTYDPVFNVLWVPSHHGKLPLR